MDRQPKLEKNNKAPNNKNKQQQQDINFEQKKAIFLAKLRANSTDDGGGDERLLLDIPYVPKIFQADKEVVLAACQGNGWSLEYASSELKANKEVVLVACKQYGRALKNASPELKANKEVVLVACQRHGGALKHASDDLKADKDVILAACQQNGRALRYASDDMKSSKEIVLAICRQHGLALEFASENLRADAEVVTAAAASNPDALKFAAEGLKQNPNCLKAAKVWDVAYDESSAMHARPKIVLSTRFSLTPNSDSQATMFPVLLKENEYILKNNFFVYSPNAFAKDTCDPEWTRYDWPCRGTFETCEKLDYLKMGVPQPASCWRYSFRYQLEKAKETNGCMVQLVEREEYGRGGQCLGYGQKIETAMANDIGTKVFRVYAPEKYGADKPVTAKHIKLVTSKLCEWYESGCTCMSEYVVVFDEEDSDATLRLLNTVEVRRLGLIDL